VAIAHAMLFLLVKRDILEFGIGIRPPPPAREPGLQVAIEHAMIDHAQAVILAQILDLDDRLAPNHRTVSVAGRWVWETSDMPSTRAAAVKTAPKIQDMGSGIGVPSHRLRKVVTGGAMGLTIEMTRMLMGSSETG